MMALYSHAWFVHILVRVLLRQSHSQCMQRQFDNWMHSSFPNSVYFLSCRCGQNENGFQKVGRTGRVSETSKSFKIRKNSSETLVRSALTPSRTFLTNPISQDAILCEGRCNTWLHRKCDGPSTIAYEVTTSSPVPFYCPHGRLDTQESEIALLKRTIQQLVEDVHSLGNSRLLSTIKADTIHPSGVNPSSTPSTMYSQVVKTKLALYPSSPPSNLSKSLVFQAESLRIRDLQPGHSSTPVYTTW